MEIIINIIQNRDEESEELFFDIDSAKRFLDEIEKKRLGDFEK